ncbi:hypothetical protein BATDEDRAFT_12516 [Batrachochytrium dendrobatidis JAM81]|uniref:Carbonic anhydrase n=2 Tax=Batrachochytrium dendrobatidis TaxID=109871 RepID=F4P7J2_BATDJ|nr:uncharacterized protein BATDEDRAFT_12516 [Batrachochytrium dendrobatidis JAM81]EGF79139.1 hypothetical protein BATDEDRAFT_12516 [Batrachochytrium dendrobatidis JAM81]|eukprot:XP_006680236.1 hypothetical protein BATDEDRAFT_12516 [Batrachochytrium dendrobatidis JAM81]
MTVVSTINGHPEPIAVSQLLENNRLWAKAQVEAKPEFFQLLAQGQQPDILWIGCSDSRVPPTEILQLGPGDAFVHRNIANVVVPSDLSFLSVLQYAVEVLMVRHIVVCGHYSCGGVLAAMSSKRFGLIDNWLQQVKDVYQQHIDVISALPTESERSDIMCELNTLNSLAKVTSTSIVRTAWERGQPLTVHGWCYRLSDGCIRDLGLIVDSQEGLDIKLAKTFANKKHPVP